MPCKRSWVQIPVLPSPCHLLNEEMAEVPEAYKGSEGPSSFDISYISILEII